MSLDSDKLEEHNVDIDGLVGEIEEELDYWRYGLIIERVKLNGEIELHTEINHGNSAWPGPWSTTVEEEYEGEDFDGEDFDAPYWKNGGELNADAETLEEYGLLEIDQVLGDVELVRKPENIRELEEEGIGYDEIFEYIKSDTGFGHGSISPF